ncbi:uncharacterized protein BDZ99DRAFT_264473 [Mytilinidion resinicola]|uniref:Uncharacterized protein n=1 Tax=Mytilinidion resinicola TaxID=574789 RepID=A0A6A6YV93_9PEZI|nr:uncharacterized protein BDZ99DRAFT_264473 [Mytilinidion resinicola]KAF2812303.1 hypothetical protein BDZ99DRAFT_264473 [Mytilinidion resinicola]
MSQRGHTLGELGAGLRRTIAFTKLLGNTQRQLGARRPPFEHIYPLMQHSGTRPIEPGRRNGLNMTSLPRAAARSIHFPSSSPKFGRRL